MDMCGVLTSLNHDFLLIHSDLLKSKIEKDSQVGSSLRKKPVQIKDEELNITQVKKRAIKAASKG
jgi:hypothetical protein